MAPRLSYVKYLASWAGFSILLLFAPKIVFSIKKTKTVLYGLKRPPKIHEQNGLSPHEISA
jgi:hypothetical protein